MTEKICCEYLSKVRKLNVRGYIRSHAANGTLKVMLSKDQQRVLEVALEVVVQEDRRVVGQARVVGREA